MKLSFAVIGAAALAVTANAQTISLHPGETLVVTIRDGKAVVDQRSAAKPMSDHEAFVLRRAQMAEVPPGAATVPPGFVLRGQGPANPPPPTPDEVEITMRRVPGGEPGSSDQTALFLANGYGSAFNYSAVLSVANRALPTDVCDVPPHVLGLEHWPYPIDQLDLSNLQLQQANGAIHCQ